MIGLELPTDPVGISEGPRQLHPEALLLAGGLRFEATRDVMHVVDAAGGVIRGEEDVVLISVDVKDAHDPEAELVGRLELTEGQWRRFRAGLRSGPSPA